MTVPSSRASPPSPKRSRPGTPAYLRARRDRGEETRSQLIEAGIDVFGRHGFDGATTRQIAHAAGVNLAAIVYHFGGKEALYLAVADHIAEQIFSRVGPVAASLPPATTPEAARDSIARMLETMVEVMLGTGDAERWAPFVMQEQRAPTQAFERIYGFMGPMGDVLAGLVATALGREEPDEDVHVTTLTLFGQVLVFRVAQTYVLRRTGWKKVGERERELIKRTVIANMQAILDTEVTR